MNLELPDSVSEFQVIGEDSLILMDDLCFEYKADPEYFIVLLKHHDFF
jgi:hypothetical protein